MKGSQVIALLILKLISKQKNMELKKATNHSSTLQTLSLLKLSYSTSTSITIPIQQSRLRPRVQRVKRPREESVKEHTTALYRSNISTNQHAKLRMRQHTEYKKNFVKKHTGKLASYIFDRDVAENYLCSISQGWMDLGQWQENGLT